MENNVKAISKALRVCLIFGAVISAIQIMPSFEEIGLLIAAEAGNFNNESELIEAFDAAYERGTIVGYFYFAVYALSAVLFCIWTFRANRFVRDAGAKNLRHSPGWSVGWFFVPILSFWKPYQAMSDLSRASSSPADWASVRRNGVLPLWWAAWIGSIVFGALVNRAAIVGADSSEIAIHVGIAGASIIVDLMWAVTFVLAYVVVSHVSTLQDALYKNGNRT